MPVGAWVNGVLCGLGQTLDVQGQLMYTINVSANGPSKPGCGTLGQPVIFRIGSFAVATTAAWDNHRPMRLDLPALTQVFLPIVQMPAPTGCAIFASADVPKDIPDNLLTGISSTLFIPGPGVTIVDLSLNIDHLLHTYDRDLQITLVAPDNTSALVVDSVGEGGDNFIDTHLNDLALTPIISGTAPFTGSFRPDNPLSVFRNLNSAGVWTLVIVDRAARDTGTLYAWSLEVCNLP
jgi:subtilisin-like proprotein convertase family protein